MKIFWGLVLAAIAVCASGFAPLDDTKDAKAQITKMLNAYADATKNRDASKAEKVMRAGFTPDASWIDRYGKKSTLDELILQITQSLANTKSVSSCKLVLEKISVQGATATTTESMTLIGTTVNPSNQKKTSKLDVRATWRSTYVRKGAKWLCSQGRELLEIVKIDGKRFPPPPPPQKAKMQGGGG